MSQTFENGNARKNIKGLFANPRTRTILLVTGALVTVMLLVGFWPKGQQQSSQATGTQTVQAPNVQARPGTVTDTRYQDAIQAENDARLKAAQEQGKTVLPTLTGPNNQASLDPLDNTRAPTNPATLPQPQPIAQPVPPPAQPQPQAVAPTQAAAAPAAVDVTRTARYKSVEEQIKGYMKAWGAPGAQQEFDYVGQGGPHSSGATGPATGIPTGEGAQQAAVASAAPAAPAATTTKGASFVRAGTIIPAVLMSSINSDTPGPVVAQIVSGPLAGARLLGNFQSTEKEIVVRFSTLSMPGQPRSFSINAYAVNSNLGTGLATDVDNHYFRRYGLLLAAGFIKGYGQAIGRAGTTTTVTDGGGVIITQDELSDSKIAKVALGEAGTTIASDIQQASRVRPTVKVNGKDGSGVPIGLLFMNDF